MAKANHAWSNSALNVCQRILPRKRKIPRSQSLMPNEHPVGELSRFNVFVLALSLRLETRECIEKIAKIALDQENNHTGSKDTPDKARDFFLELLQKNILLNL